MGKRQRQASAAVVVVVVPVGKISLAARTMTGQQPRLPAE